MCDDHYVAAVTIDEGLVRRLLEEQHPDVADLPLVLIASGWDNVNYRLGDDLTVRLPHRVQAAELIAAELRWLPVLADGLPLPISAPIRGGAPALDYPWQWIIGRWLPGENAAAAPISDDHEAARTLGTFLAALHQPAPSDAPINLYRGIPLSERNHLTEHSLAALGDQVDAMAVRRVWAEVAAAPTWEGPPLWLHGDLHPANVLVDKGRLSAVIDWGDVTSGDPATDLFIAWMMFDRPARKVFFEACGTPDDATQARARGWALAMCLAYLASPATTELMKSIGRMTLPIVLGDAG